jgi:opacity protein-like surface antigen
MKKIIYITIATAFSCSLSFGQDKTTDDNSKAKSFIGITGGYANAMGNFVKNDYEDEKSGYANSAGFNMGLEGAYYFHKNIGIGGVFSNTSFYAKGLQTLADGYKDSFEVDSTTVTVKGKYSTLNFLIGPYFSFPVKKFTFDIRVVGGLVNAKTPEFTTYLEDQEAVTFVQKSATANTFGFQAGAGVRYSIIKNLCVKLNADFYYSQPNFKITNENRVVNAGRLITDYKQPIMGMYLNFGIAYQLGK